MGQIMAHAGFGQVWGFVVEKGNSATKEEEGKNGMAI